MKTKIKVASIVLALAASVIIAAYFAGCGTNLMATHTEPRAALKAEADNQKIVEGLMENAKDSARKGPYDAALHKIKNAIAMDESNEKALRLEEALGDMVRLRSEGEIDEVLAPPEEELAPFDVEEVEGEKYRPALKMLPLDERLKGNSQVVLGYDPEKAIEETKRCLRCDLEER